MNIIENIKKFQNLAKILFSPFGTKILDTFSVFLKYNVDGKFR